MIVVASTFSNNSLRELHVKYFSRTCFRLQHSSRIIHSTTSNKLVSVVSDADIPAHELHLLHLFPLLLLLVFSRRLRQ